MPAFAKSPTEHTTPLSQSSGAPDDLLQPQTPDADQRVGDAVAIDVSPAALAADHTPAVPAVGLERVDPIQSPPPAAPPADAPIGDEELDDLNAGFERSEPAKIVSWAAGRFGRELVMSSSFGAESALLIHMTRQVLPDIRIIMVDTGYLFPETHRFMEELRLRFDLNVWVYRTLNDPIAYLHQAGEENPTWRKDVDACCAANKNEPMQRAMRELLPKAWLRGIRRNQAETRKGAKFIEYAPRYGCYAISPLLNWSGREIYAYMKAHDLPYHPLYEQGYLSIGCNPLSCTRPVQAGEDPRAGRWSDAPDKVECGINLTNSLDSAGL